MDIDQYIIDNVKGFLDEDEGRCLYETALEAASFGPCLEIGSYCGKSTIYLGAACKKRRSILYAVDHHRGSEEQQPGEAYFDADLFDPVSGQIDTFREFRKTVASAGIEDAVVPIVCRSEIAGRHWAAPLSLVFIDGGHALETVRTDYDVWSRTIMAGGYLIMHDIFPNPADGGQAPYEVYRQALASGLFQEINRVKTLGVLRKLKIEYSRNSKVVL